mgnify:CR=1 FL=1|tara:strand:+ start:22338 stop:23036 length:699 start_codon:yes stop_codon:yes gene_type:complete
MKLMVFSSIAVLCSSAHADMVRYENTNENLQTLKMYSDLGRMGQTLNITASPFDQPIPGDLPEGSILIMETHHSGGDFIWMGMGRVTTAAKSTNATLVPDPWAGEYISYYGPQGYANGDLVDESANFNDGWRMLHGANELTDDQGVFSVAEVFTVAMAFELSDGMHYGYAQIERTIEMHGGEREIEWHPLRWGYETQAGVAVSIVPAPGALACMLMGVSGFATRRRRSGDDS